MVLLSFQKWGSNSTKELSTHFFSPVWSVDIYLYFHKDSNRNSRNPLKYRSIRLIENEKHFFLWFTFFRCLPFSFSLPLDAITRKKSLYTLIWDEERREKAREKNVGHYSLRCYLAARARFVLFDREKKKCRIFLSSFSCFVPLPRFLCASIAQGRNGKKKIWFLLLHRKDIQFSSDCGASKECVSWKKLFKLQKRQRDNTELFDIYELSLFWYKAMLILEDAKSCWKLR